MELLLRYSCVVNTEELDGEKGCWGYGQDVLLGIASVNVVADGNLEKVADGCLISLPGYVQSFLKDNSSCCVIVVAPQCTFPPAVVFP